MTPELLSFLQVYGIPALAFLVGHSQLLAPLLSKIPLLTPKKPTDPIVRPIGQGGIIDLLGILAAQIISHPTATPDAKAAALSEIAKVGVVLAK